MAGFDNEVMFASGERLQVSSAQDIQLMQQTSSDVSRVNHTGDPNGVVSANPSSISHDPVSGEIWRKESGTGNTGWVQIGEITLNADDTNSLTSSSFNLFGQKAGTIPVMDTLISSGNFLFENRTWETQYVVDPSSTAGTRGTYSTIQSAINAAVTGGASVGNYKKIYIRTGSYTENLTIPAGVMLVGQCLPFLSNATVTPYQSTYITGNHTFASNTVASAENITFLSASGDTFTAPALVIFYMRNCSILNSSGLHFSVSTAASYLSLFECTFSSGVQTTFNITNITLAMRHCNFLQEGVITQNNSEIIMIDCTNIGTIASTLGMLTLINCTFSSSSSNYNLSGNAAGTIQDCYFSASNIASVQNTMKATLLNCQSSGVGTINSAKLFQTGYRSPVPYMMQGNIIQVTSTSITNVSPGQLTNNSYFNAITNTGPGTSQFTVDGIYNEGQIFIIKDVAGTAATNPIQITSSGGVLIDGKSSVFISENWGSYTLRYNGTNFNIIGQTATNAASATVAAGSAVSLTTATPANVTSISLSPGTWVVSTLGEFGGTPTVSGPQQLSISTTSATHGTVGDNSSQSVWLTNAFTAGPCLLTVPSYILRLGSTTTVYMVASGTFSGGTLTAYGRISAFKIA